MWILESKGDFFQGRRMWMKPGKQYLFGRVKNNGVQFALAHKTVSRKHFIIKIDEVSEQDVANIHARSKVTIIDQKSKTGTVVNGETLKDTTQEVSRHLNRSENIIRVGGSEEEIVVRWQPCVLTFNLLKKEIKAGVLKTKQERVRELDIKAVSDYLPGTTTHLVVNKRNTAKGLQALIDGTWLVAESWIDSFEYAATPADLDEEEHLSPLEQDFDKAWPDATAHLPPAGKEKTLRSENAYQPDAARNNIFENFTFVFADQMQYDNLLPPISLGHGKAVLYNIVDNETTVDELVSYLQKLAGNKGFGSNQRESDGGAVILVRWNKLDNEEWTNDLINQVALKLDQRVIDQSEFLDAILANDALSLRHPVPYESNHDADVHNSSTPASLQPISRRDSSEIQELVRSGTDRAQVIASQSNPSPITRHPRVDIIDTSNNADDDVVPSATTQSQEDVDMQEDRSVAHQSEPSSESDRRQALNRRIRRTASKPGKFDFDDDFDPEAVIAYEDSDSVASDVPLHDHQEASVTPSSEQPGTPRDHQILKSEPTSGRKRTIGRQLNPMSGIDGDGLDDILPGAAAMKRQKLANGRHVERSTEQIPKKPKSGIILPAPRSRTTREIDVKEELRAKRAAEVDGEADDDLDGVMEVDESGNVVIYDVRTELVDLPVRRKSVTVNDAAQNGHWDPKWNGRKNFKAFRRAWENIGAADAARHKPQNRVIVPLVDAPRSTYGIGEQYWSENEEEKELSRARKKRASQRTTQSQQASSSNHRVNETQTISSNDSDSDNVRDDKLQPSAELTRLQNEAVNLLDHEIDPSEPRHTRSDDHPSKSQQQQTQSSSTATTSRSSRTIPKRPAGTIGGRSNAKKQKTLPVTTIHGSDSDDSDDLKFQFGKASRRRGKDASGTAQANAVIASSL